MKNLTKRLIQTIAAGVLLLGTQAAMAVAISVNVVPPAGPTVNLNDSFDVQILIDDVAGLTGFQFDLGFDASLLSATGVTSGGIFDPFTAPPLPVITAGNVAYGEASLDLFGPGFATAVPTVIATISFTAIGVGTSGLDLSSILLSDTAFPIPGSIPVDNTANGSIEVVGTVPLPGTLVLCMIGLLGLGAARRR